MALPKRAGAVLSLYRRFAATAASNNHSRAATRQPVLQQLGNVRPGYGPGTPASNHFQTYAPGPGRQLQGPFTHFTPLLGRLPTSTPQALAHPKQALQQHPFARLARLIHSTQTSAAAAAGAAKGGAVRRTVRVVLLGVLPLGLGLGSLWVARTEEGRSLLRGYLALPVRLWRDVVTAAAMTLGKGQLEEGGWF